MPLKLILFILFLSGMATAHAGPLMNRITQLRELQEKINTHCLNNPNRAQVQLVINGTTLTCSHLIVLANRLRTQLQEDVTELEESCEQDPPAQPQRLAADAAAVSRAAACRPVSTDAQCLPLYGCAVFTMANPLATLIGGAQRLAGNRRGCLAEGAGAAPGCLQNVVKGIFDSLWGLLSLVWDVGRAAVRSIGEWTGLMRRQERSSSERLMAAQQSGPGFIRRFISNPGQVMNQMISSMFNGIKDAAMNSYGCESWSGAPFVSRCLRPMTNWNCASCQQKLQLMCGVAGFAVGEIGTALLTGGLAAGAKFVARAAVAGVRAGARASRFSTLARGVIRTLPRPPPALTRATENVAAAAGRTLSAAERNAIRAFNALSSNPLSAAIARGARGEANTLAGRAAAAFTLRPAALYLEALENAAALGFRSVDGALARTTGAATDAAEIARVAEAARPDGLADVTASVPPDAADVVTLTRTQVDELAGPAERNVSPGMVDGTDDINVPDAPIAPIASIDSRPPPPQGGIVVGDSPVPVQPVTPVAPVAPVAVPEIRAPVVPTQVAPAATREITPALQRMAGLSDPDRVAEAGIVINRPLTSVQEEAILQAHRVGEGTGRGYFTYTAEEIAQKGFILREAGFSATDIRKLMREGVTGSIPAGQIPELNALQTTARGLSRNSRGVADMRIRDLNYSQSMTPDQINQRLEEARGLYRSSGDGFAAVARSPQGTAQDYLSAIDGYTRSGNIDEAARLVREAGSKVNLPDVRADVQRNLDAVIARRADNPRNPELGAQEQNLRNLLARIEPTPAPRAPVPAVSPTQREADFLRAYADGKVRDLNYATNTREDISRLSSEAVTSFRSSGDGYAAIARTSRSADDYLRAMDSYARAYSPEARTMIDRAISAGARRPDIEARLQARITELRELRTANPRNTEYGVQISSYEDLLSQVRRQPASPTPAAATVRTPTPTPTAAQVTPTPVTPTPVTPTPVAPLVPAPVRPRATITSNDYWPPERDPRTMRPVDRGPAERTFWRSLMSGNGEDAVTTARATARLTTGDRTERLNSIKELVQQSFFNRGTTFSEKSMTLQQRRNLLQVMDEMGEKYTDGTSFGAAREFRDMRESLDANIRAAEAATPNP